MTIAQLHSKNFNDAAQELSENSGTIRLISMTTTIAWERWIRPLRFCSSKTLKNIANRRKPRNETV